MYNASSIVDPAIKVGSMVKVTGWLKGPTGAGVTPRGYQVSIVPSSDRNYVDYYIEINTEGC